jgi:hypothetical protein
MSAATAGEAAAAEAGRSGGAIRGSRDGRHQRRLSTGRTVAAVRWWEARRSSPGEDEEELGTKVASITAVAFSSNRARQLARIEKRTGLVPVPPNSSPEGRRPQREKPGGSLREERRSFSGSDSAAVSGTQSEFASSSVRHK